MDYDVEDRIRLGLVLPFLWATMELGDNPLVVDLRTRFTDHSHDSRCSRPMWPSGTRSNIALQQVEKINPVPTGLIALAMWERASSPSGKDQGPQPELGGKTEVSVWPPRNRGVWDH